MLEVKNLTKVYSGKGGVTVKALDDVSVVFPEKGMVFLLGKSGSGKSTLLNVAGGLDKPDGGEVIVKGKSSKDFSGSDFDSYRNTFIGFVFQEYNILNEFTIEQNISLALQLQNKPNDKKAVAELLEQVDLAGYAKRKPNTLSGGQKQRVAIARALIKEPEIIMADEPTGALDSNTGKQVLDTLKKLSEKKLVIVVSHDREFAEYYGDRIIELKDGKIISDVSKVYYAPTAMEGEAAEAPNVAMISEDTIAIKNSEALTDEDVRKIADMLRKKGGEAIITADQRDLPGVKRACKINENGKKESFKDTEGVESKEYDGSKTKFIKSRLPLGHAIKMGASGLKSKPIRLIFTILLSVAAFVLFGVVSTFMLYDPNYSVSEAMRASDYPAATIAKSYTTKIVNYTVSDNGEREYDYDWENTISTRFGASEVQTRSKSGLDFAGVFNFTDYEYQNSESAELSIKMGDYYLSPEIPSALQDYYFGASTRAVGFSDCGAEYMTRNGFTLIAGRYPTTKSEVALPQMLAEPFLLQENGNLKEYSTLLGKEVKFSFNALNNQSFTIVGIYNVGTVPEKYTALKNAAGGGNTQRINAKEKEALTSSYEDYLHNSFHLVVFVTPEFYEEYKGRIARNGGYSSSVQSENYRKISFQENEITWDIGDNYVWIYTDKTLRIFGKDIFKFYDKEGNAVSYNAGEEGIYLSKDEYDRFVRNKQDQAKRPRREAIDNYYYKIIGDIRTVPEAEEENVDNKFASVPDVDYDEVYEEKLLFAQKWYPIFANRKYLYRAAEWLTWQGDEKYTSGTFYAAYQAINDYRNWNSEAVPTAAMWNALKETVEADLSESAKYGFLLDTLQNELSFYDIFEETWSVIDSLKNGSLSAEEFVGVKDTINTYLAGKGIGTFDGTQPFALDDSIFAIEDLPMSSFVYYYRDKNEQSGVLSVLGYFESQSGSYNSQYFLPTSFMNAHAIYEPYQGTYQIQVTESNYTVPADAKYNYLVSPTDNSMDQISAMLSTEKGTGISIQSTVYQELQMFLEMIEELEKIFLYVGLGVGVLAAFFLLNFISVSISTKRKDIGILRAVGARGSDVFKIFYAEAFIIAFICFVLACVGSLVVCYFLNQTMLEVVSMKLLNFGPINIALIFGISIFVSVIATFFPVYFAARKSPVESIRSL